MYGGRLEGDNDCERLEKYVPLGNQIRLSCKSQITEFVLKGLSTTSGKISCKKQKSLRTHRKHVAVKFLMGVKQAMRFTLE